MLKKHNYARSGNPDVIFSDFAEFVRLFEHYGQGLCGSMAYKL